MLRQNLFRIFTLLVTQVLYFDTLCMHVFVIFIYSEVLHFSIHFFFPALYFGLFVWRKKACSRESVYERYKPVLQSCAVAKSEKFWRATWQAEWKTGPPAKVQLFEYENQTLQDFVATSLSFAKFNCPVSRQLLLLLLLSTARDCETGLYII